MKKVKKEVVFVLYIIEKDSTLLHIFMVYFILGLRFF